jgi:hypothetical protein
MTRAKTLAEAWRLLAEAHQERTRAGAYSLGLCGTLIGLEEAGRVSPEHGGQIQDEINVGLGGRTYLYGCFSDDMTPEQTRDARVMLCLLYAEMLEDPAVYTSERVPRVARVTWRNGHVLEYRMYDGVLQARAAEGSSWGGSWATAQHTPESILAIADVVRRPQEIRHVQVNPGA